MVIICNVAGVILDIVLCLLFTVTCIGRGNGHPLSGFCGMSRGTMAFVE